MKKTEIDTKQPPKRPKWVCMGLEWITAWILGGPLGTHVKIRKHNVKGNKAPWLIFATHQSMKDFPIMAMATFPHRQAWVISIDEFIGREYVLRNIGGVAKRKYTKDSNLVRTIVKTLKKGQSVIIYPEARWSFAGILEDVGDALGKVAKLSGVPVMVMNHKGNYLSSPQWNKKPTRRVPLVSDFTCVATKEDCKMLSADELQDRIKKALEYDEHRYQIDNHIKIKSKYRAHNIHRILFKCPCCGKEVMNSNLDKLWCDACHQQWTMDEYGYLVNDETKEKTIVSDWYRWEREEVNKEVNEGKYSFTDEVRIEKLYSSKTGFVPVGKGVMTHNDEGMKVIGTLDNGEVFDIEKSPLSMASVHIEFNYKDKGDAIDFNTIDETYFIYPLTKKNPLVKIHFATEALYKKYKK